MVLFENCQVTAVQEKIDVVLILFNDGGYGVLRNIQSRVCQEPPAEARGLVASDVPLLPLAA